MSDAIENNETTSSPPKKRGRPRKLDNPDDALAYAESVRKHASEYYHRNSGMILEKTKQRYSEKQKVVHKCNYLEKIIMDLKRDKMIPDDYLNKYDQSMLTAITCV
jgi:hypothetical protein